MRKSNDAVLGGFLNAEVLVGIFVSHTKRLDKLVKVAFPHLTFFPVFNFRVMHENET